MLEHLFRKVHASYSGSPNGTLLDDFATWLISAGYARHTACRHVRGLTSSPEVPHEIPKTERTRQEHRAVLPRVFADAPRYQRAHDTQLSRCHRSVLTFYVVSESEGY